jgi:hypothetical protein
MIAAQTVKTWLKGAENNKDVQWWEAVCEIGQTNS